MPTRPNRVSSADVPRYKGREVVDVAGHRIGKVSDVIYDDSTLEPGWVIVDLGLLAAAHYVPLDRARQSGDGRLVVPFDKRTVKHAPRAHREHILTRELEQGLRDYYDVAAEGARTGHHA